MATYQFSGPIFRPEPRYPEKRQLFLRSYQFSRKQTLRERLKRSLISFKRTVCFKIRSARRFRKFVWTGLRSALYHKRFRRLAKLLNYYYYYSNSNCSPSSTSAKYYELFYSSPAFKSSSCFW